MRKFCHLIASIICLALIATAQEKEAEPDFAKVPLQPSPEAIAARNAGIETAWTNAVNAAHQIAASQGFRRRDTRWTAELPSEGFTIVPLQLYAGNDYYVVLGTDADAANLSISMFDPERMLIKILPDAGNGKVVLHITPKSTGPHYLRIHQKAVPQKPTRCALTYVYR